MQRSDPQYRHLKEIWELTQTPAWKNYLRPLLERKGLRQSKTKLRTIEDFTQRIADEEKADTYRSLLSEIEREAKKYTQIKL